MKNNFKNSSKCAHIAGFSSGGGLLSSNTKVFRLIEGFKNFGEGMTLSRIAKIRSRSLSNSTLSLGERKFVGFLSWERGRGEGKMFAQQTETTLVPQYLSALVPSKKAAFTLAEVLVTLGIIGVVSALTLPTLVKNHQRQVFVTQLHKVYNELSQAFEAVISDSNAVSLSESRYRRNGDEWFLRNYFKTVKVCSESEECFGEEYSNLNGTAIRTREITGACGAAILSSGASVCIRKDTDGRGATVIVDVNGLQEPNIVGRDLFDFDVLNDGTISVGDIGNADTRFASDCSAATDISYGTCMAKIINDGWKMDY